MAGIYIHIPFCRKACAYCNFHFSTTWKQTDAVVQAIEAEIPLKSEFLTEPVTSIYFGGGTPSVLSAATIHQMLSELHKNFTIDSDPEVTLEANPDDTSFEYYKKLREIGINRLSIGTQSFYDKDLAYLGRVHNANQAIGSIRDAQRAGFDNITIDFIYGMPTLTDEQWLDNLQMLDKLDIPHFSAYALTIEPKTLLEHQVNQNKVPEPDEAQYNTQFQSLISFAETSGFDHYEISNFARNGFYAIHNSSYWDFQPYAGIGPGAHSFDGHCTRQWNLANNAHYVKALTNGKAYFEQEILDKENQYNEFIMTALRTKKGLNSNTLQSMFGVEFATHFEEEAQTWLEQGCLEKQENHYKLKPEKTIFADQIIADLFKA